MNKTIKNVDISLITQLLLSVLVIIIGVILNVFKSFGLTSIILYVSMIFYIYAFISVLLYFIKRREGDYELLLLGLINVITATLLFAFKESDMMVFLGTSMIIYTVLIACNRAYKIYSLKKIGSFMWVVKLLITILLVFLGLLTAINLYGETTVQTLMYGYYFVCTGILLTIENLLEMFLTEDKFRKIIKKALEKEEQLEEINEEPVKKVVRRKTVTKKGTASKTTVRKPGRPKKVTN